MSHQITPDIAENVSAPGTENTKGENERLVPVRLNGPARRQHRRRLEDRQRMAFPDLVEALKTAERAMQNDYQGDMAEAFKIVRAALKKAGVS